MSEEKRWGFGALGTKTKIIMIIWFLILFIGIVGNYENPEVMARGSAIVLIYSAIGYLFACFCQIIARERDGDTNFAFLFGFFFGILAGLFYWIIYSFLRKEVKDGKS